MLLFPSNKFKCKDLKYHILFSDQYQGYTKNASNMTTLQLSSFASSIMKYEMQ